MNILVLKSTILAAMISSQSPSVLEKYHPTDKTGVKVDWSGKYEEFADTLATHVTLGEPLPYFIRDWDADGDVDEEDRVHAYEKTALLVTAVSYHETGFKYAIPELIRGDSGRSRCSMQINSGNPFLFKSGWKLSDLETDLNKCFDIGLQTLQHSTKARGNLADRLTIYASGTYGKGNKPANEICWTFTRMAKLTTRKWCTMRK